MNRDSLSRIIVRVREYAWLSTEPVRDVSLDYAQVSETAFEYLCALGETYKRGGARLLQIEGRHRLKLDNFVGVVETPCGTIIEIVPKHHTLGDDFTEARLLLRKLLLASLNLSARDVGEASLQLFDGSLSEWVMRQFLQALDALVRRGICFDYQIREEELRFLRGLLNLSMQLRQPPGRSHHFHVRHEVYVSDRPENRLLKLALECVRKTTQDPESWRLAHELSLRLEEVPASQQVSQDFRAWSDHRLLAHYRSVKSWCELILNQHNPLAISGDYRGLSLLFPMEKLFEKFVTQWLRKQLSPEVSVRTPARNMALCFHEQEPIFQMEPDILVTHADQNWVLDTKWKLLDSNARSKKYGLSQSDFYQLYAYGQKYMSGVGRMALIYPSTESFTRPLSSFSFSSELSVEVLPFDLKNEVLIGLEGLELPLFTPKCLKIFF